MNAFIPFGLARRKSIQQSHSHFLFFSITFGFFISLLFSLSSCVPEVLERKTNEHEITKMIAMEELDSTSEIRLYGDNGRILRYIDTEKVDTLYLGKFNFTTNEWDENETCVIILDSQNRLTKLYTFQDIISCSYTEDNLAEMTHIYNETDYKIYKDINLSNTKNLSTRIFESKTKSSETPAILSIIQGLTASLELARGIVANGICISTAISALDYLSVPTTGLISVELSGLANELKLRFAPNMLSFADLEIAMIEAKNYLCDKIAESLFGKWSIRILSAKQISKNKVSIECAVSGIKDNHTGDISGTLELYNNIYDISPIKRVPIKGDNGIYNISFDVTKGGVYKVVATLSGPYSFFIKDTSRFPVVILGLNDYAVQSDYLYKYDEVEFHIITHISGDIGSVSEMKDYGIIVNTGEKMLKYPTSLSSLFSQTEKRIALIVNRNDFDIKNYSSYHAEVSNYTIGVYAVIDNNTIIIDEQPLHGLVYDKKPEYRYYSAYIERTVETDRYTDDDGNTIICYETTMTNTSKIVGTFWVEGIKLNGSSTEWGVSDTITKINMDNESYHSATHVLTYSNRTRDIQHQIWRDIILTNGKVISSVNGIEYLGSDRITGVRIFSK